MSTTPRSRSRRPVTPASISPRAPEDDLPEVVSTLWDAAKDAVLGAARVWRSARSDVRADQLLLASVDVLERAERLLGAAFEHAPATDKHPE